MNTSLLNRLLSPTASAQASRQRCDSRNNHDDDKSSSYFQPTVCLYDWWLIKSDEIFEGKRLAVAGFTCRDFCHRLQAMRVFASAPIVKRYDIFTLETADGICIILKGFINKLRTKENGFSDEVFSHFLFGFPRSWEAYNEKCSEEEFTTGPSLATIPDTNGSATGHDAVAGMKNANPNTTSINYEVNGKNKHIVEDINECSENVSEVTTNASKGSDWQNHAAEDNNIEKAKDHASENLLPSMSCDINVVNLPKDNLAFPAESPERMANSKSCDEGSKGTVRKSKTQEPASLESLTNLDPAVPVGDSSLDLRIPKDINVVSLLKDNLALPAGFSSYNVTGSPERMANSKSCDKGSKGTVQKSKTQEPASLESLTISNAALEECPIAKASDVEILNSSNLDPAVPVGDSSLDLRITSTKSKTQDPSCLESTISNAELEECPINKASDVENLNSSNVDPFVPMGDSGLDLRVIARKSKTQEPACLESISIGNAASGECSISKASDIEYLKSSNLDPAVPVGNPGVDLRITSSRPKHSEPQDENGGEKPSGVEGSSLSGFGLGMMHTPSLSTSAIYKDPNYRKPSGNCVDDAMNFPTVESDTNVNGFTPTKVHTNTLNVSPSNSGSRKTRSQNKRPGFTGSVKCKNKELMPKTSKHSDGENLKSCSSGTAIHSGKKIDLLEAARSQSISKMVRNMNGNSKGKKKERHTVVLALKTKRKKMGSATLVSDGTSNLEGMNIFNFCDDEPQQPTHDTVVKDNSKQGKDHRKESQAGAPRQKPNNSDRSRNEFSDTNHRCESVTAVGEREATAEGDSSKKKAQRKINFDTQASPLTQGRKENIVSPESLSLKRSRSGRLLLPSLDFWRNQIAVYDEDHKITGIQVATPSKGSKSEPPPKKRRR